MASVTTKLSFVVLKLVMMVLGGLFTLFGILVAIITHPFTVFKKVPRNGERLLCHNIKHTSKTILFSDKFMRPKGYPLDSPATSHQRNYEHSIGCADSALVFTSHVSLCPLVSVPMLELDFGCLGALQPHY